ncbi:hypothetical protein [Aquitalea pelogenes]|uniref:hypothetical protein n=1 Tax=Aquitalea pelogenes TaxID=1293573 RepID=UPI0035B1BDAC
MKKKPIFTVLYKYDDEDVYHKDLEHDTLQDAFNEVLHELYPECLCETHRCGRILYVNYQNEDDEDDCGEFELPYTLKAIQKYITDFVESNAEYEDNNAFDYSEIVIKKSFAFA